MIVYITTNIINGHKYIGKDEANNPKYLGSGLNLKHAIKKYGKHNFVKETICYAKDRKDLEELEQYYIDYYGAQKSNIFYNISPGGAGGTLCLDYKYREKPVYEINPISFEIIKEYKSAKEAATTNNLNYKNLNSVCNGSKREVKNRMFVFKEKYDAKELLVKYTPKRLKYVHLSLKTGVYYFDLKDLYNAEFTNFTTFSSFINYLFKHKEYFLDKLITQKYNGNQP